MSINLTPPPALRGDDRNGLVQMHSFLFRLTEQLNAALQETDRRILETEKVTGITKAQNAPGEAAPDSGNPPLTEQYESLMSLIIKTAHTVQSEMDVIESTLKSDYMAWSDWGSYDERVESVITQTASGVVENYTFESSTKPLKEQVADFDNYMVEASGYIQKGIIKFDESGAPVIGIAIGQDLKKVTVTQDGVEYEKFDTQRSLATYTADRVTFWQNGVEVAWFSSSELVCVNIRAEDRITLGSESDSDQWEISRNNGFTIKWIGGND